MLAYYEEQFKAKGQFRINLPTATSVSDLLGKLRQLIEPWMKQTEASQLHNVSQIRLCVGVVYSPLLLPPVSQHVRR